MHNLRQLSDLFVAQRLFYACR